MVPGSFKNSKNAFSTCYCLCIFIKIWICKVTLTWLIQGDSVGKMRLDLWVILSQESSKPFSSQGVCVGTRIKGNFRSCCDSQHMSTRGLGLGIVLRELFSVIFSFSFSAFFFSKIWRLFDFRPPSIRHSPLPRVS